MEPYLKVTDSVNGQTVRQSKWIDWNLYVDELRFAQAFRTELVSVGFNSNIGMLIDTSRNGWGGSARPTGPGTTDDVDTLRQRLPHRPPDPPRQLVQPGRCRPRRAAPGRPGHGHRRLRLDQASGRVGRLQHRDPERRGQGLRPDVRPDLRAATPRNGNNMSGALADAPISGAWFSAQFQELMQNAYPAL